MAPYRLDGECGWEVDLAHVEELLLRHSQGGKSIRGLVVNNPSNPTGAVYSQKHLREIVRFCQQHRLPLIADEVYGDLTFSQHTFYPLAQVAEELGRQVPVITASGIGKQFLLPGWRVGWIVFHDK